MYKLLASIGLVGALATQAPASLTWLTVNGAQNTNAKDISADGSVVVGAARINDIYYPFMWENGAATQLPGVITGNALAISPNGMYIVGNGARFPGGADNNAGRWDRTGIGPVSYVNLGSYGSNTVSGNSGYGVADNGRAVGRQNQASLSSIAWLHQPSTGYNLPPEGYSSSRPLFLSDISADGTDYAGGYNGSASVWIDGVRSTLPVNIASRSAGVSAISTNSLFAVGSRSVDTFESEAFLYGPVGLTVIGTLPGLDEASALDVSDDGTVVVGESEGRAFVWTPAAGIRDLNLMLSEAGIDMTGAVLFRAEGVSTDGRFVTGTGFRPGGATGFVVDLQALPEPGLAGMSSLGLVMLSFRRRRTTNNATA